jgi:glutathione synthase/RimK-type ligase-like ATP-grasp enzyme
MINTSAKQQNIESQTTASIAHSALIGLAPLMRQAFSGMDMKPLGAQLIEQAASNPDDANLLMDLSTVLQLTGNREVALATQAQALALQPHYTIPATHALPDAPGIRLLAIMAPGDLMANTPLEFLVEQSDIQLEMLYMGSGVAEPEFLPAHDVLFIAVGQSDANLELLIALEDVTASWPLPVLNLPQRIACLSREGASAILHDAAGVSMPLSIRIEREVLAQIGNQSASLAHHLPNSEFPIIARPVASHAGMGLVKLDTASEIAAYLDTMPDTQFYVSRFVDYRNLDGLYRKYRIILINGKPFICHMAISNHWMIHYLNAGMTESQEKRDEEARFMARFDQEFAIRHRIAFDAVFQRLGLDYVGLDCAETPDGKLLIFEVDSDMIVHALDPLDQFGYKQAPMQKLFAAFRTMLGQAAMRLFE